MTGAAATSRREALSGLEMRLLGRDALAGLPPPQPLIDDTLDQCTVGLLAGPWGSGKSFLAQDWSASIATGQQWLGRDVRQGPILYIASEGAFGMHLRLSGWEAAHGIGIRDDAFSVLPLPIQITTPQVLADLCDLVDEMQPQLVVIDTLARCSVGLDENSAKDMGRVVDALYQLRDVTGGGSVLVVHHTGKDSVTVRGSSALEAGVDTVYQVKGNSDHLVLSRTKRKEGPTPDLHHLQLATAPGIDTVVIERHGGAEAISASDRILSTLVSEFSQAGATSSQLVKSTGLPRSTLDKAAKALVRQGRIRNVGEGRTKMWRHVNEVD